MKKPKREKAKKSKRYVIYVATNKVNGKQYVGQSCDFARRKRRHISDSRRKNCQWPLERALKKWGTNNFEWNLLSSNLSLEEANIQEEQYISALRTIAPYGYNLQKGGFNKEPHPTTRHKLRLAAKRGKNHPWFQRVVSPEEREFLSKARSGDNSVTRKLNAKLVIQIYLDALNHHLGPKALITKYESVIEMVSRDMIWRILTKRSWKTVLKNFPDIPKQPIHPNQLTEEEKVHIGNEYESGATSKSLAQKYGVSQVIINRHLRRQGILARGCNQYSTH